MPLFRNASSRRRLARMSYLYSVVSVKMLLVGLERDGGAAVGAFADDLDLRRGGALAVRLAVYLAVAAADLGDQQCRKRVHARYAHAVQAARNLVAALVELAAGMEHRQHHFERRFALLFVVVGRDAAAVVAYGDGVVLVDRHVDVGAVARQRLVDRVVDHLVDQMVQTLLTYVADIHGGALAHRFEALRGPGYSTRNILLLAFLRFLIRYSSVVFKISYKYTKYFRIIQ